MNHIDDEFWNYPDRPEHGKINPGDLPFLLKRIYDQRSRTLHFNGAEIDTSLGTSLFYPIFYPIQTFNKRQSAMNQMYGSLGNNKGNLLQVEF